jgi:hypothetical protein
MEFVGYGATGSRNRNDPGKDDAMHRKLMFCIFALLTVSAAGGSAFASTKEKLAVFPFGLIDDSYEGQVNGVRADQTRRLAMISDEALRLIRDSGRYDVLDTAPIKDELATDLPIHACNGCEDDLARKLGAGRAIIATVQKVSNLILNLNIYVRDVKAERTLRSMSVDIRGNTDESWMRGIKHLVQDQLLKEDATQ